MIDEQTKRRNYAAAVAAWAEGKEIEVFDECGRYCLHEDRAPPSFLYWQDFRVKPRVIRYKVAQMKPVDGNDVVTTTADDKLEAYRLEKSKYFAKWLTDWIEIED